MPGLPELRRLDLTYDASESEASAERLIYALFPEWLKEPGELVFKHFTEGITNTVGTTPVVRTGTRLADMLAADPSNKDAPRLYPGRA